MTMSQYHFVTHWRVFGTIHEVADILRDVRGLARWWSSVYLDVEILEPGAEDGFGTVACVCTRGWVTGTLLWQVGITEARYPYGFSVEAWGDVTGHGTWTFTQDGPFVNVVFDWTMRFDHALVHLLSFLVKPIVEMHYRRMMARGEENLCIEVAHRRVVPSVKYSSSLTLARPGDRALLRREEPVGGRTLDEW